MALGEVEALAALARGEVDAVLLSNMMYGRALAPPVWLVGAVTLAFLAWPIALLLRPLASDADAPDDSTPETPPC